MNFGLSGALGVFALAAALGGCVTTTYTDAGKGGTGAISSLSEVIFQVHDSYRQNPPDCIAVLPFRNSIDGVANNPEASLDQAATVRRAIYAHLSPQGKRDVEIPHIDSVLNEMTETDKTRFDEVGKRLDCDALIVGDITEYGSTFLGVYSRTAVGADLKMIRAKSGEVLWEGAHVAESHGGSIPLTPFGIATGIMDAALNVDDEQRLRVLDDLARRLSMTIPDNRLARRQTIQTVSKPLAPVVPIDYSMARFLEELKRFPIGERVLVLKAAIRETRFQGQDLRKLYRVLIAHAPQDLASHRLFTRLLMAEGDYFNALVHAERALALNSLDPGAYFLKGRIQIKLNDLNGADASVLRAISLAPSNDSYYGALGFLNSLRGNHARALAAYKMAIDLNSDNGFALYNIGVTLNNADELNVARDYFFKAGMAYLKDGEYGQVVKVLADLRSLSSQGVDMKDEIKTLEGLLARHQEGIIQYGGNDA